MVSGPLGVFGGVYGLRVWFALRGGVGVQSSRGFRSWRFGLFKGAVRVTRMAFETL